MCDPHSTGTRRRHVLKKFFSPRKRNDAVKEYIRNSNTVSTHGKADDVLYLPGAHNYKVRSRQVEVDDGSGDDSEPSILSERRVKTQFTLQGSTVSYSCYVLNSWYEKAVNRFPCHSDNGKGWPDKENRQSIGSLEWFGDLRRISDAE